jgi:hypothetical protein
MTSLVIVYGMPSFSFIATSNFAPSERRAGTFLASRTLSEPSIIR